MNLVSALQRNPLANAVVKTARINRLVDLYLGRFPLKRQVPSGLVYRMESVPSLVVANEIFATDVYARPIAALRPTTFIDLGSNVGYFPVLVAEIMKSRAIKGLCVEPNPSLHPLIEYHLGANGLTDVHLVKGVVAGDRGEVEADFYLNPSHIASSATGSFNPRVPLGGRVRKIKVPVVDIAREREQSFPGERVGLLKIDIEGAEIEFLKAHASFLERVDAVLIEWHSWATTLDEVTGVLRATRHASEGVCHEDKHAGTVLFVRHD